MSIIQMEPTRQTVRAIMSPSRAAHLARYTDGAQLVFLLGTRGNSSASGRTRATGCFDS